MKLLIFKIKYIAHLIEENMVVGKNVLEKNYISFILN